MAMRDYDYWYYYYNYYSYIRHSKSQIIKHSWNLFESIKLMFVLLRLLKKTHKNYYIYG